MQDTSSEDNVQKFTTFISEGIKHDRYERAHGKKAKGSGMWMFTTKRTGEPTEDEVFMSGPNMNLAAAGKEAMKALKSKEVYVMESVEQIEEAPKIGRKGMVQGKDGDFYKVEMIPSNRSIEFKITNQYGDFQTISVAQLAKKFR